MAQEVFIALQNNDESRAIIEAIVQDNPACVVFHYPAMVKINSPEKLFVNKSTVESKICREWDVQELHINLISLGGNIDETDDYFALQWKN